MKWNLGWILKIVNKFIVLIFNRIFQRFYDKLEFISALFGIDLYFGVFKGGVKLFNIWLDNGGIICIFEGWFFFSVVFHLI